jgi:hypothetical protein
MSFIYPECRHKYTYSIGSVAEQFITDILKLENFKVKSHKVHDNGVDICLENDDAGIEVWNWREPHCYDSRFQSVIENLQPHKHRFLVTSYISKGTKSRLEMYYKDSPIVVIDLGYQLMPKKYESFYTIRRDTEGKKFVSRRTMKVCRSRLAPLFNILKKKETCTPTSEAYVYNNSNYVYSNSNLLLNSTPSTSNNIVLQQQNRNKGSIPGHFKRESSEETGKVTELQCNKKIKVLYLVDQILKSIKMHTLRRTFRHNTSRIKVLYLVKGMIWQELNFP